MNKQTADIHMQHTGKYHDSNSQPLGNHSNIIPFPIKAVTGKQPASVATGERNVRQSIHGLLLKAREHLLRHIPITNLPADGQRNGKYDSSARTYKRATG